VAPQQFALAKASEAFDAQGQLIQEAQLQAVRNVVQQVVWAAQRLRA
jgi:hypothetical protein